MAHAIEYEVRIYDADPELIRERLMLLGGVCIHPKRMFRRLMYDSSEGYTNRHFFRLRDEGDRTTFTYKSFVHTNDIDGIYESEVVVSDFETMRFILEQFGHKPRSYQESYRETRNLGPCEIVLDWRPHLQPIIEIEGPDEQSVRTVVADLGYERSDVLFGNVVALYRDKLGYTEEQVNQGDLVFPA